MEVCLWQKGGDYVTLGDSAIMVLKLRRRRHRHKCHRYDSVLPLNAKGGDCCYINWRFNVDKII